MKPHDRRLASALFLCAILLAGCAERRPVIETLPGAAEQDVPSPPPAEPAAPVVIEPPSPDAVALLSAPPLVRVLVFEGRGPLRLHVPGGHSIGADDAGGNTIRVDRGGEFAVRVSDGEVTLVEGRRKIITGRRLRVAPEGNDISSLNGKSYRGGFLFAASRSGVAAVNVLDIDEYLKGVLPSEIGYLKAGQYEAFRAQAIAARSYALSKLDEKSAELYDLNATVMDQVYAGVSGESEEGNRAVDETRGLICSFLGKPARAFYCACCGGHTADIRAVWPWKTPYPYLYGVRDTVPETPGESLCRLSRHFRWQVRWTAASLGAVLRRTIPREFSSAPKDIGKLLDVRALGRGRDGRVSGVEIETDRGSFTVQGDRIRWVMRPERDSDAILRSTLFVMDVSRMGDRVASIDLLGGGNGHGVGMCQTGAVRMAEIGYSGEEIIAHYYPGTRIAALYR